MSKVQVASPSPTRPDLHQAQEELRREVSAFTLPPEFELFEQTREVTISPGLILTFKLPNSIDSEWASFHAARMAGNRATAYVPRILAACLLAINGKSLDHYVNASNSSMRTALHPTVRKNLRYAPYLDTHQWVYENVIGKVHYDLLRKAYVEQGLGDWMDSAGGLIELPTTEKLQQEAEQDLHAAVSDSAS